MFVKPRANFVVRDPRHMRPLPATGRNVPDIAYWARRLRDGDVVEADEPAQSEPAEPSAPVVAPVEAPVATQEG